MTKAVDQPEKIELTCPSGEVVSFDTVEEFHAWLETRRYVLGPVTSMNIDAPGVTITRIGVAGAKPPWTIKVVR